MRRIKEGQLGLAFLCAIIVGITANLVSSVIFDFEPGSVLSLVRHGFIGALTGGTILFFTEKKE